MQGKEYEVLPDKSSSDFTVDVRLNILDEALKEEDINDKPYYMYVNKTGEIFESKMAGHYMLQILKMKQNIYTIKTQN